MLLQLQLQNQEGGLDQQQQQLEQNAQQLCRRAQQLLPKFLDWVILLQILSNAAGNENHPSL